MVVPEHTVAAPMMAVGVALTFTVVVMLQPPATVYVTIVVPRLIPHKIPVVAPIVPTAVLPLCHVPPVTASLNVVQLPVHTAVEPLIAVGDV